MYVYIKEQIKELDNLYNECKDWDVKNKIRALTSDLQRILKTHRSLIKSFQIGNYEHTKVLFETIYYDCGIITNKDNINFWYCMDDKYEYAKVFNKIKKELEIKREELRKWLTNI